MCRGAVFSTVSLLKQCDLQTMLVCLYVYRNGRKYRCERISENFVLAMKLQMPTSFVTDATTTWRSQQ
jgi:hypothetical protein